MKQLYTHEIELEGGDKVEVFLKKPNHSEVEDAEFAHGQKFNELLSQEFMSRAMMDRKFQDIGGVYSEKNLDDLGKSVEQLVEAQKVIEFFEGGEDLSDEQREKLAEAKNVYTNIQLNIATIDSNLQAMYDQSADAKAESYMVKWFVLQHSYFNEQIMKEGKKQKQAFPIFEGNSFKEKLQSYGEFLDDVNEEDSEELSRRKQIAAGSLIRLSRIVNLWYNDLGKTTEELDAMYEQYFEKPADKPTEEEADKEEKPTPPKKKVAKAKKTDE